MVSSFPFYAKDIMSTNLIMARPEMSSAELEALLLQNSISGAPVVDQDGRLVGVISMVDIIASGEKLPLESNNYYRSAMNLDTLLADESYREIVLSDGFVSDYMTRDVLTVNPDTPLSELARMMYEERIHRLVVVDAQSDRLVGIISTFDLLKILAEVTMPSQSRA